MQSPHIFQFTSLLMALALLLPAHQGQAQVLRQSVPMTIAADPALERISVKITPGLTKTRAVRDKSLQLARVDMLAGKEIRDEDLRGLALLYDGLAAQKYVRRLEAMGPAEHASDIAYFGSIAVSTGRIWTLPAAVEAMHRLDPATEPAERTKVYMAMLYPHAWAGNSLALDALIDFNGDGRLFGPMSERTRDRIIAQGEKAGDGRVLLRLALTLLQNPDISVEERAQAASYLRQSLAVNNLAVQTVAKTLLANLDANPSQATQTE